MFAPAIRVRSYCPQNRPAETRQLPNRAIGFFEDAEFDEATIELASGDRLYFYSDGMIEEVNPDGQEFGNERLEAATRDGRAMTLEESVEHMASQVIAWRGSDRLKDDLTILGMEIR